MQCNTKKTWRLILKRKAGGLVTKWRERVCVPRCREGNPSWWQCWPLAASSPSSPSVQWKQSHALSQAGGGGHTCAQHAFTPKRHVYQPEQKRYVFESFLRVEQTHNYTSQKALWLYKMMNRIVGCEVDVVDFCVQVVADPHCHRCSFIFIHSSVQWEPH